jgi:hypothetical protein
VVRLAEDWPTYRLFDTDPGVPWTHNPTEPAIGRMKMRPRTVGGCQPWPGMHNGLLRSGTRLADRAAPHPGEVRGGPVWPKCTPRGGQS